MHNKKIGWEIVVLATAVLCGLGTESALATEILTISDGTNTQTVSGNGSQPLVFDSLTDSSWLASSPWTIAVAVGAGTPLIGSPETPDLHLSVLGIGVGTLTISLFESGFTAAGPINAVTQAGGVTDGTVSVSSSTTAGQLAAFGPWTDTAFSGTAYSSQNLDGSYGLDLTASITQTTVAASSLDASVGVPEPGTFALLGAALLGMAVFIRRQRGVAAES